MDRANCARRTSRRRERAGFTLIETALATVIVGVGVLAMVSAHTSFHRQNSWSTHASIAERLGNEIREMTLNLPRHDPVTVLAYWGVEPNESDLSDYDDLDDLDGGGGGIVLSAALGNGPVNARREVLADMAGWAQLVRVYNVDPFDITGTEPADGTTDHLAVEVIVTFQGTYDDEPREMTRVTWIAPN